MTAVVGWGVRVRMRGLSAVEVSFWPTNYKYGKLLLGKKDNKSTRMDDWGIEKSG